MQKIYTFILLICIFSQSIFVFSREYSHWETAVYANYKWKYFTGTNAPPTNWYSLEFDDQAWPTGKGGFGYGDGDDSTIISPCVSVFIRIKINVADTSVIGDGILHMDYDDAFVAFINGAEIARSAGLIGDHPGYNQYSSVSHEASMYLAGKPETFLISKSKLRPLLKIGENLLAIQVHNAGITSTDMSAIAYLSFCIWDYKHFFSPTPSWFVSPVPAFSSSNLPLIMINTNGIAIPDEPKLNAKMGIIDNGPGKRNFYDDDFNGYNGNIAIEIRGSSSQMFPKKGYGFETRDSINGDLNVSLLTMPQDNDWVLYAPYSDKTMIRNVLAYNLGAKVQGYAPRTKYCELFLNNNYSGLYVLTEKVKRDKNRVNVTKMSTTDVTGDAVTGGYIFKLDRGYDGTNGFVSNFMPANQLGNYVYVYPKPEDMQVAQKDYLQTYFRRCENALYTTKLSDPEGYSKLVNVDSFVDYLLLNEFIKNVDSYRLSVYMHKDRDSKGGKLNMGPLWDCDLALGNANSMSTESTSGWMIDLESYLIPYWWKKLIEDPGFQDKLKCRWTNLRTSIFNKDTINTFIDSNRSLISEAADRNFSTFPIIGTYVWPNSFIGKTYDAEIVFLKDWIANRIAWMDKSLPGTCNPNGIEEQASGWFSIYPNPFSINAVFSIANEITGPVNIDIYNLTGSKIQTIVGFNSGNEFVKLSWDGTAYNGSKVADGIYLYTLKINSKLIRKGKLIKAHQ